MALEDYMEPEVGVAVALTALVASPKVRNVLRQGAVYGLAGLLMAGDAASSLAQGVKRGVQQAPPSDSEPAMPEILSADGQSATPEAPVAAAKYTPVSTETTGATEEKAEAPATHKRARKASEAVSHE